MNLNRC